MIIILFQFVKRTDVNNVTEKAFRKSKSAGYKKIHQRTMMDAYAALSKRQVPRQMRTYESLLSNLRTRRNRVQLKSNESMNNTR